jgi:PAS domain S-box-containing protein
MKKKPIRVLLLEDNPGDARLLREYLHETDLVQVELDHVERLKTCLEHLARGKPDVILLDLGLPDSQGLETFTQVYAQAPEVPIVVLTGLNDTGQAVEAVRDGAQDYLVKGDVSGGLLVRAIRYAIERKQAEVELMERNATLNAILESAATPVFSLDRDYRYTSFNSAHAAVMKALYGAEVEIGQSMLDYQAVPADREEARKNLDRALCGEQIVESAYSGEPGRTRRYFEITHNPICDTTGEVIGVSVFVSDITERKQAEEKLAASEAELRALFASMQDVVLVIDREGVYRKIAPTNLALLAKPTQELLGKNLRYVFPAEQAETFLGTTRQVLETHQTAHIEYELMIGERKVWFSASISSMNEDSTVWVTHDITEHKWAEQKLAQYSEYLEEMVAERTRELTDAQEKLVRHEKLATLGQIAGSVSHELRNPLGIILNAVYYLKLVQPDANEKVRHHHAMIEQETHNAEKIISDLLEFARLKSTELEPVSVAELVQHTLKRFPVPKIVTVALKLPADLPMVFADPRQVEQMLGNMVVNACQAMKDGGQLTISAHHQKEMVTIVVNDTGVGIPPENMPKLFEPLFTTKINGIGLGLPICKKLAEANGGRIEVQSEPGKGSTFTVYLPAQEG